MAVLKFSSGAQAGKKKKKVNKTKPKIRAKRKVVKRRLARKKIVQKKRTRVVRRKKSLAIPGIKKRIRAKKSGLTQGVVGPNEEFVGKVTHYFPQVRAAVIKIVKSKLALGDRIHINGHTSDFTQVVDSMQIEHVSITKAKKGDEIGLRVNSRVRINDKVYKIVGSVKNFMKTSGKN